MRLINHITNISKENCTVMHFTRLQINICGFVRNACRPRACRGTPSETQYVPRQKMQI